MEISRQHLALCFYGNVPSEDFLKSFFDKSLVWFQQFGYSPTYMGKGSSKKVGGFKRISNAAAAEGFSLVKTKNIRIYSTPYDLADPPKGSDFEVAGTANSFITSCYFRISQSGLTFSLEGIKQVAKEIINCYSPPYGLLFPGQNCLQMAYFALGIGYETPSLRYTEEESNRLISWREFLWAQLFRQGFLGGVYPWNFLTPSQLNARVGSLTLQTWIQERPRRGTLEPLSQNMVLWAVSDDDIAPVWHDLWQAGVVFDYERDIVAKMDQFHVSQKEVVEHLRTGKPLQKRPIPPPLDMPAVVGDVMKAFGYDSAEQAEVLKVEKPGKTRKLSAKETQDLLSKKNKKPKKQ